MDTLGYWEGCLMRMCLECGCVAYVEYAYQVIVCRSCGKTWSIQQYEWEERREKTKSSGRRLRVRQREEAVVP